MTATVADRVRAQRAEDLRRLADRAERAGVRILLDRRTGRHAATDPNDPTRCHFVGTESCTCKRFALLGTCEHTALLLAQLGLIPDAEEAAEPFDLAAVLWADAEPARAA